MSKRERDELAPEERDLVQSMREHYAPAPRGASRRTAFRQAVEQRMHRPRIPIGPPALAAAGAAALAIWLAVPEGTPPGGLLGRSNSRHAFSALAFDHDAVTRTDHDILPSAFVILADVLEL